MSIKWRGRAAQLVLSVVVVVCLAMRLGNGFDLSDEAYYAAFVDDWLKGSISSSSFLVLHQTAAILVYPAAAVFKYATGSVDGLFLFLRSLFLIGNVVASLFLYAFLRRATGHVCAFFAALAFASFIPFGLPAPSYNTLGLQALTIALSTIGCACLHEEKKHQMSWIAASAIAWALTAAAYPTLVFALPILLLLMWLSLREKRALSSWYCVVVAVALASVGLGLLLVFSVDKLLASIKFLAAFNGSDNLARKLDFTAGLFTNNMRFAVTMAAAGCIGVLRYFFSDRVIAALTALLFLWLLCLPVFPAGLLMRSHDAVALGVLTGMGMIKHLRGRAEQGQKVMAILYVTSVVAGLIAVASATNGLFNFCIGAAPAALIAVASLGVGKEGRWVAGIATGIAGLGIFISSLTLYFAEAPGVPVQRTRMDWGPAKWLAMPTDEAVLMNLVRDVVAPRIGPGETIAALGRAPGLGTLTTARPKVLSIYAMYPPFATQNALDQVLLFYQSPANRPEWVLIYRDPSFNFINPFAASFPAWYEKVTSAPAPGGELELYRKR